MQTRARGRLLPSRKAAQMRDNKPGWNKLSIIVGMVAGAAFVILFVRMPRWAGEGNPAYLMMGIIFCLCICGAGFLGGRLYRRYGCRFGLHAWDEFDLPCHYRECSICGLHQKPIDPFKDSSRWKYVTLVRDGI